jgi:DNA-binding NarL/FixJ family response regulator
MPDITPKKRSSTKSGKNSGQDSEKISVLLVDDHNLVRLGFRRILEDEQDMQVVAEASNGEDAIAFARKLRPAVIVMDCALPGMSGLVTTRAILQEFPNQVILMLSMHAEDTLVRQAIDAGARGYILKNAEDMGLGDAIRRVAAGESVLSPAVSKSPSLKGDRDSKLTTRELEVLQLIADGHSNKAIADQLKLSVNTVAVHRANIMDALGIHKTAELIVYAIRNGLVNIS